MKKVFLFLVFAVYAINAQAKKKSMNEYWVEAGISPSVVNQQFSVNTCYSHPQAFMACVVGLEKALELLGEPVELTLKNLAEGEILVNSNKAVVQKIEIKEEEKSLAVQFKEFQEKREARYDALLESFWSAANEIQAVQQQASEMVIPTTALSKYPINFLNVFQWLRNNLPEEVSVELMTATAFNGFLTVAADPHTYIVPSQFMDDKAQGNGEFAGIGVLLRTINGKVFITKAYEGFPAASSGIKDNDIIIRVNGEEISTAHDVVERVVGPSGDKVTVEVKRGEEELFFEMIRKKVNLPDLVSDVIQTQDGGQIGYMALRNFSVLRVCEEMLDFMVEQELNPSTKGYILDLRGNGGGRVNLAECISSLFIGNGKRMMTGVAPENQDQVLLDYSTNRRAIYVTPLGEDVVKRAKVQELGDEPITNKELVVLVNAGSASASEIVAGVIQDYGKGVVIGDTTFGKGTAQAVADLGDQTPLGAVYMARTFERWVLPSGRQIQSIGIEPDYKVDPKLNATADEKFAIREADMFINALQANTSVQYTPKFSSNIQNCISNEKGLDESYKDEVESVGYSDYQKLFATKYFECTN